MALRASCASGNFTTAATWATIDPTLYLDSEANNTSLTTTYVASAAQTPGAITIDGIAIKVATRAASPTGTMSVRIAQGGSLVAGTEVTINVSDINVGANAGQANQHGWIFFKFAAPVTLAAATAYTVDGKTSSANMINLFRDATANNWSHMVRTTTTGAPAAGDTLYVLGEHTGTGTGNNIVVDMDSTASTDYGPGTDGSPALVVGKRGTLQYKYAASTNYYLKLSGNLIVYSGGVFTIGTVANPIPRTSTAVLEFDPVATGGMGIDCRGNGTVTMQGLSRSSGKDIVRCLLNTDEAAAQTTLGVDTDTGWLNGDEVVIASTSRTPGDSEARTLNADAGASSISVSAGLTNAHSGTAPTQAEVICLTRNVIVRSAASAKMTWLSFGLGTVSADPIVDIDWVRFRYCGSGHLTNKAAILTTGPAGASGVSINACAFDGGTGTQIWQSTTLNTHSYTNNVFWLAANTLASNQNVIDLNTGAWTFSGNAVIAANTAGICIIRDCIGTFTNNRFAGLSGTALRIAPPASSVVGSMSGNVAHSCGVGLNWSNGGMGSVGSMSVWRNAAGNTLLSVHGLTITDLLMFGNSGSQLGFSSSLGSLRLVNAIIAGDTTFASTRGISIADSMRPRIVLDSCQIGVTSGIYVAHTTSDIIIPSSFSEIELILRNTVLGSTVEVETQTNLLVDGFVGSSRHDQTAGTHKTWKQYGTITTDATAGMYRTSSPSERLTPNNASGKLRSAVKRFAVASGATATVSVYVRESVAGDGTDYNGARARLVLKANPAAGIAADTVLATATISSEGAFELLSGTTAAVTDDAVLEVYVDCDGTTGWCNVDDWSVA